MMGNKNLALQRIEDMIMKTQNTTEIKRGDLYLYDFGNNEGSIQCGLRPVLVLQSDRFSRSPTVIVAAITSVIKKQYLPSHVILESRFGLQQDSMVMLEQIRTVNRSDLQKYIGSIDDESVWRKINNAIKKTFGLWFYNLERTGDICCLCSKCLSDYKKIPALWSSASIRSLRKKKSAIDATISDMTTLCSIRGRQNERRTQQRRSSAQAHHSVLGKSYYDT